MIPASLATGQAGVLRVASELLLRRVDVRLPIVDAGVDLLLEGGVRVQVKSARQSSRHSQAKGRTAPAYGPAYRFLLSIKKTYFVGSFQHEARPQSLRQYSDEIDYLVLWGIDEDRFWIAPAALVNGRQSVVLMPRRYTGTTVPNSFSDLVSRCEGQWDRLLPQQEQTQPLLHSVGA